MERPEAAGGRQPVGARRNRSANQQESEWEWIKVPVLANRRWRLDKRGGLLWNVLAGTILVAGWLDARSAHIFAQRF